MTENIELKILTEKDINTDILNWYLDKEVTKFSDNQYRKFTLESQKQYIRDCNATDSKFLYGIFYDKTYIGNMLISNISKNHKTAEISYFIGNRKYWGKGIMTTVIKMVIDLSKAFLKINKLYAGVASENYSSIKALEKNNFIKEGNRIQHLYYNFKYYDQIDYGLILNLK